MSKDIFRTVRELLENPDEVLMGNAVDTEGKLYADSVENLTAILAMEQDYKDTLEALKWLACEADEDMPSEYRTNSFRAALDGAWTAITRADGEPA
jgi:acyl carrier protein